MPTETPAGTPSFMVQYYERLNAAEEDLRTASPEAAVLIEEIREAVEKSLGLTLKASIAEFEGDSLEAVDDMEFYLGSTAAENFAKLKGITDETILAKVREFGFHIAALWIQLRVNAERDREMRVAQIRRGRDPDESND